MCAYMIVVYEDFIFHFNKSPPIINAMGAMLRGSVRKEITKIKTHIK